MLGPSDSSPSSPIGRGNGFKLHQVTVRICSGVLGKVAEWFKAAVLKTAEVKASVGSNPTLSVTLSLWKRYRTFLLKIFLRVKN